MIYKKFTPATAGSVMPVNTGCIAKWCPKTGAAVCKAVNNKTIFNKEAVLRHALLRKGG